MSEKRRGRPRDGGLDEIRVTFGEDVPTRMSLVNRRDMMEASRVLGLNTADGEKEFAYIVNNGNLRKTLLTHLGRYIRRYKMSRKDVREFARFICKEKVRAKEVEKMLIIYRRLKSRYKMSSYDAIELAWTICQGKLKLRWVERMLRSYGMRPRSYETEDKEEKEVVFEYFIKKGSREEFQASIERLTRLLYRPDLGNGVEITYKSSSLKEEEIEKLVKEGKLRPLDKNRQMFEVKDGSDELD